MSSCNRCGDRGWLPSSRRDGWPVPCPTCATSVHGLARKLDVDVRTIRRLFKKGTMPRHHTFAKRLFDTIVAKAPELLDA